MKKLLTLVLIAMLATSVKSQDVPNPGFENWIQNFDYYEPEGWGTLNLLGSLFGNPFTVFRDSITPHTGNYALNLQTIALTNNPDTASLRDTIGVIFTGSLSFAGQLFGFPYSQKPNKLSFYYKYLPTGTDTMFANAQLFKWNSTTMQRDTLASGYFYTTNTVSNYIQGFIDFTYNQQFSGLEPDTAMITFASSNDYVPMPGSSLFLDDLSFDFNSGIEEANLKTVLLFPNPAGAEVNFKFSDNKSKTVQFYDASGKMIAKTKVFNEAATISVLQWSNGTYLYKTFDDFNTIVSSGRFNVSR